MYIWVILATFIAALYAFNLNYRSDIRSITVEPIANAFVSKLIIKQQAAGNYIKGNTPPKATISNPDGSITSSDTVTYTSGIIELDELQPSEGSTYLPYGYKDDGSVTTEIYCLDKDNYNAEKDCADENAVRFLVAYTPIPQKWLNVKTGLPNNDLTAAMINLIGTDLSFGYPLCKTYIEDPESGQKKCDKMVIKSRPDSIDENNKDDANSTDNMFEIPEYIAKNGGFADTCNNDNNNNLCLMYIYEYKAIYYN